MQIFHDLEAALLSGNMTRELASEAVGAIITLLGEKAKLLSDTRVLDTEILLLGTVKAAVHAISAPAAQALAAAAEEEKDAHE